MKPYPSLSISKRDHSIDMMRFLSLLIILFHHLPAYGFNLWQIMDDAIPLRLGFLGHQSRYMGLGSFIFISGYLLYGRNNRITTLTDIVAFLKKRFFRIYPLYYLALVVYVAMFYLYLGKEFTILNGLTHLVGLQLFYGAPVPTIWFVGLITVYYMIFALIMYASQYNDRFFQLSALFFAVLVLLKVVFPVIDSRLVIYWPVFVFGLWFSHRRPRIDFSRLCAVVIIVSIASWIYMHKLSIPDAQQVSLEFLLMIFVLTFFMGGFAVALFYLCKRLSLIIPVRWLFLGAYSSYAVYLFHSPVLQIMKTTLGALGMENNFAARLCAFLVTFIGLFGASYSLQLFADARIMTILNRQNRT